MFEDTRERPIETQLYWVSSRYYSPELCRFISPDDIEYLDPESVNGLNLYCYCMNNPISYCNPSGHFIISTAVIVGLIAAGIFILDAVIETSILMSSDKYKAENVYDGKNVKIPNSAGFNNPIAQMIYSKYLYKNVKKEDGSNFFTGDPYDILGEWQAHNFAADITGALMVLGYIPLKLFRADSLWSVLCSAYYRSIDVDLGENIAAEDDWYVRLPSNVLKWINKVVTLNCLEW